MTDTETSVLFNSSDSMCLLKTAVARVVSDTGSDNANILFDEEGAQHSFISERLANTLQLTPYRQENVSLAAFGADASTPQHLDVTDITIISHTGERLAHPITKENSQFDISLLIGVD